MREVCKNCAYYKIDADGDGECHRNPPTVVASPDHPEKYYLIVWPMVKPNDWCGEFKSKETDE